MWLHSCVHCVVILTSNACALGLEIQYDSVHYWGPGLTRLFFSNSDILWLLGHTRYFDVTFYSQWPFRTHHPLEMLWIWPMTISTILLFWRIWENSTSVTSITLILWMTGLVLSLIFYAIFIFIFILCAIKNSISWSTNFYFEMIEKLK